MELFPHVPVATSSQLRSLLDRLAEQSLPNLGSREAAPPAMLMRPFENREDVVGASAQRAAAARGMRFIDESNIDDIDLDYIGPNDYVFLTLRHTPEIEKAMAAAYNIRTDQQLNAMFVNDPLSGFGGLPTNGQSEASAFEGSEEAQRWWARLQKQLKAGGGMTRFDIPDQAGMVGPGVFGFYQKAGIPLVMDVSNVDVTPPSFVINRSSVVSMVGPEHLNELRALRQQRLEGGQKDPNPPQPDLTVSDGLMSFKAPRA